VVGAATAVGWPLYHGLKLADTNILMLYLLGVLWVATHHSRGAAVLASVLGVLSFDFAFVPPYLTLTVHDQQYLVTFAVMLMTALLISELTHRVRRQSEAARAAWERVETEFLRNTLLSGVSHELRTPLAGITGAASTLLDAGDRLTPAARREMLDTIVGESERMERLINNLLDMTRMESGGGPALRKEWVPLQEIVGSALRHVDRLLQGRPLTTDLGDRSGGAPGLVHVDAVAVEQVIVNLIHNAIEHTPPASPIEISARSDGDEVAVEVADRGPGLPAGTERRVFEKFFRIQRPGGRRGIGLGLAICHAIVEAHQGTIAAANRAGGGTVFRFTLPRAGEPPVVNGSC
jgi:two-component system sensor histidine kinase KdpD